MNRSLIGLAFILTSCTSQTTTQTVNTQSNYSIEQPQLFSHLAYLSSDRLQGRKVGTTGSAIAQEYLSNTLKTIGAQPYKSKSYLHPFVFKCNAQLCSANNVVGYIKGKRPTNNTIVLSAHYDHIGKKGRKIYNGADDNASGVAALLMIGEMIVNNPLEHNTILLLTDAEESNLKGAHYFLAHHREQRPDFILNINLDMLAGSLSTRKLHYITHQLHHVLSPKVIKQFKLQHQQREILIKRGFKRSVGRNQMQNRRSWQTASDHGAFLRKKIPFIYYGVGLHENYHTENDDYKHINKEFFWHSTNVIYDQLRFIDDHLDK